MKSIKNRNLFQRSAMQLVQLCVSHFLTIWKKVSPRMKYIYAIDAVFFNLWSLYFLSRILLGRSWITISFRFPSVFLMISNVSTLQVLITRNFWSLTASWFSFFELYLLTLLTCKYSCFRNYFVSTYIFTFFERVNISNIVTYEVDIATNLYTEELDT